MFANFGAIGVIVGMGIVGIFMAALDRLFNRVGMTPLEAVTGLAIFTPLVYQESNFSLMVGSILPLTLCLYVYFRVGLGNWSKFLK